MTKLIFVHGINNENRDDRPNSADIIRETWLGAISDTATRMGVELPGGIDCCAAFYGDELADSSSNWDSDLVNVSTMGSASSDADYVDDGVMALYREYQRFYNIQDRDVLAELDERDDVHYVRMAGGIHKSWLKAITRALEKVIPTRGRYIAKVALRQAAAYLHKRGLKEQIDDIVMDQVFKTIGTDEKVIVVAHSLGTVVTYDLLRRLRHTLNVDLFLTLGSPLGIEIVKDRLGPPLLFPKNVKRWVNGADNEDFVALYPQLNRRTFGDDTIINISNLDNGYEDAHSITQYLSHPEVIAELVSAMKLS
ncbi:hypothetical protein ACFFUB_05510 [Algimonas porphyrae]|uniref:Alpha/beta hydrolase n=1 Tax=Algimonas porphyrae TaxID=1128113 RepID=A0ABQ5V5D8_9PROT|nr:hypothetical protein [Algimonas porphyrae]GLQ21801.1 hypothetical protein GCM10007854_27560 [Algimonas porphyrae]